MSKVKRYTPSMRVGHMVKDKDGLWNRSQDFDRVTAERDAALGRETALREDNSVQVSRRQSALNRCEELQQRLTAAEEELDQCQSMALMIEEKEWAEHVGKGPISSQVESAFTQLHNELSEARQGMTAADERADVLESALREICNTSISADHAKLQALGMRDVAQAALGAEKSTTDFSMIGTDKMPPMEYDEP